MRHELCAVVLLSSLRTPANRTLKPSNRIVARHAHTKRYTLDRHSKEGRTDESPSVFSLCPSLSIPEFQADCLNVISGVHTPRARHHLLRSHPHLYRPSREESFKEPSVFSSLFPLLPHPSALAFRTTLLVVFLSFSLYLSLFSSLFPLWPPGLSLAPLPSVREVLRRVSPERDRFYFLSLYKCLSVPLSLQPRHRQTDTHPHPRAKT